MSSDPHDRFKIFTTSAAILDNLPAFTAVPANRAGSASLDWGSYHWMGRHAGPQQVPGCGPAGNHSLVCAVDEANPRFRCVCRAGEHQCCEHMNAEDLRCEPCRRWCGKGD